MADCEHKWHRYASDYRECMTCHGTEFTDTDGTVHVGTYKHIPQGALEAEVVQLRKVRGMFTQMDADYLRDIRPSLIREPLLHPWIVSLIDRIETLLDESRPAASR